MSGGGGTYDSLIPGDADDITTPLGFEYAQAGWRRPQPMLLSTSLPPARPVSRSVRARKRSSNVSGARAFRRPIATTERDKLLAVYDVGRTDADFASGVRLVIEAVLQSPSFLYRKAIGTASGSSFSLDS